MYSFESRIRYSEVDQNQELSVTGIINYLQDCSTFQSEDLNLGVTYLQEHHRAWWLSSWQIVIERYPRLGEEIIVSTWSGPCSGERHPRLWKRRGKTAGDGLCAQKNSCSGKCGEDAGDYSIAPSH